MDVTERGQRRLHRSGSVEQCQSAYAVVLGDAIYVSALQTIAVFPFNAAGAVAPLRRIFPPIGVLHIAIANGEIYATDFGSAVRVYPVNADGSATAIRTISGPATRLQGVSGIAVHDDEIFVANRTATDIFNEILVFPATANGDVAPLRMIRFPGLQGIDQIAIFEDEIYVATLGDPSVHVFPIDANGDGPPIRSITGPRTQLSPLAGVAVF
jgi:hypothetical protein